MLSQLISKEVENNTLKKHIFAIKLFYLFMCDDLLFINTTQKTLKPSKKMFQFPGWKRKNFIPRNFSSKISAETLDASCFKKGLLENNRVLQTLVTLPPNPTKLPPPSPK